MTLDNHNPNRYVDQRERKPKKARPPRGAITQKRNGMWKVMVETQGVKINIGFYKEKSHAVSAYWEAYKDCGND